jgi:hypothetical protein
MLTVEENKKITVTTMKFVGTADFMIDTEKKYSGTSLFRTPLGQLRVS